MPKRRSQRPTSATAAKTPSLSNDEVEILPISLNTEQPEPAGNRFVDFESILRQSVELTPEQSLPNNIAPEIFPKQTLDFPSANLDSVRLGSDEVSANILLALRQKIAANQYINLALLLKGNVKLTELCHSNILYINEKGQIESRAKQSKEKITSINQWTDAFIIFMSIYVRQQLDTIQDLLQYMSIIREAAGRSPSMAWLAYDQQFRLRQASNLQPWGKLNPDLWLRIMSASAYMTNHVPTTPAQIFNSAGSPPSRMQKSNTCLDFNNSFCTWQVCACMFILWFVQSW